MVGADLQINNYISSMKKKLHTILYAFIVVGVSDLKLEGAEGYAVNVSPTNLIVGEEFKVSWSVPAGTFTLDDWLGIFLFGNATNSAIDWKFATFRDLDTVFDSPEKPGSYEVRYFEWSLFRGSILVATSETLFVRNPVEDPYEIRNFPSNGNRIIAFGDSLVFGKGAEAERDFPSELSRRLGREIINAGVIGDTTEEALLRLDTDVLLKDPKIVIVLLGGNDVIQGKSIEKTAENIRTIITRIQEKGAIVILVGVQGGLFADRLRDPFHALAEETNVAYVPNILRGIIGNFVYSSDTVHPNSEGYKIMADRIFPALAALDTTAEPFALNLEREGDKIVLKWNGEAGSKYRILECTNLTFGAFSPIEGELHMDSKGFSFEVPIDQSRIAQKFFKLEAVPTF